MPTIRKQLAQGVAGDAEPEGRQADQQVAEIGERLDLIAQARGDQAEVNCRSESAPIAAKKQLVATADGDSA